MTTSTVKVYTESSSKSLTTALNRADIREDLATSRQISYIKRLAEAYSMDISWIDFPTLCKGKASRIIDKMLKNNAYTAVMMIDFIEHSPSPYEAVVLAQRILQPEGVLVLVTPDIHSPAARIAGRKWWHLRPAHLAFFSRLSLDVLLQRAGFVIIKEKRYAWTFSARYLLSRLNMTRPLLKNPALSSFLKRIPIKLALGDSFEIYARKDRGK